MWTAFLYGFYYVVLQISMRIWYNKRGMAFFYAVETEPRLEFAAKGRQTPKESLDVVLSSKGGNEMRFFIDTANVEEIRKAAKMGFICGVTTNPSLIAKEGRDFNEVIQEITQIVDGPISGEVISLEAEKMIEEAREIANIHPNMVVKIPMTAAGLEAVSAVSKEGIKTNVTLIFSATQALLAARAGATYVSPFLGRLDDISTDGLALIEDIAEIFSIHDIDTQIIAASIRHPMHVLECAKAGADIATVPYKVLMQMIEHPLTKSGIERFMKDWESAFHQG